MVKFLVVGACAFGFDYAVLLFLYYIGNLNLEIATAIGFIAGFAISFVANRTWVFGKRLHAKKLHRQAIEYSILVVFNFLFTVIFVKILNDHGIKPAIGKLLIMALIMCWNYALFRWVIFAHQAEETTS